MTQQQSMKRAPLIGVWTVAAAVALFGAISASAGPVPTGFKQTRDGVWDDDYESGFTDTVKLKQGEDHPTKTIILRYEIDIDEVDIICPDRVTQEIEVEVPPSAWKAVGGHWEADVSGTDTFIKVQSFWTGDYDEGTVSRAFDDSKIDKDSQGVIEGKDEAIGELQPPGGPFEGTAVAVADRGDFDEDGLNLVEFDLSSAYFSSEDGKIQDTQYDLIELVYDNGTNPTMHVGYLSPGHNTFFLLDMDDVLGTGQAFKLWHFRGVAMLVTGHRDDDSAEYDDEAGLIVLESQVVYTAPQCDGDATGDSVVDVLDLLAVLAAWGGIGGPADLTGDGIVDVLDLLQVLSGWGPC